MRSGEAKAEALASTRRDKSNTSLAAFSSCESRAPTATGAARLPGESALKRRPHQREDGKSRQPSRSRHSASPGRHAVRYRANTAIAQSLALSTSPRGAAVERRRTNKPAKLFTTS